MFSAYILSLSTLSGTGQSKKTTGHQSLFSLTEHCLLAHSVFMIRKKAINLNNKLYLITLLLASYGRKNKNLANLKAYSVLSLVPLNA